MVHYAKSSGAHFDKLNAKNITFFQTAKYTKVLFNDCIKIKIYNLLVF